MFPPTPKELPIFRDAHFLPGLKLPPMMSTLCFGSTNDLLKISSNLSERRECTQLLLAYFRALNGLISYCTLLGCRETSLRVDVQ